MRHPLSARELFFENIGAHLYCSAELHGAAQGKLLQDNYVFSSSQVKKTSLHHPDNHLAPQVLDNEMNEIVVLPNFQQ